MKTVNTPFGYSVKVGALRNTGTKLNKNNINPTPKTNETKDN